MPYEFAENVKQPGSVKWFPDRGPVNGDVVYAIQVEKPHIELATLDQCDPHDFTMFETHALGKPVFLHGELVIPSEYEPTAASNVRGNYTIHLVPIGPLADLMAKTILQAIEQRDLSRRSKAELEQSLSRIFGRTIKAA